MINVLYTKTLVPASETCDGESIQLVLTQENNGYATWICSAKSGNGFHEFFIDRDEAIKQAVHTGEVLSKSREWVHNLETSRRIKANVA